MKSLRQGTRLLLGISRRSKNAGSWTTVSHITIGCNSATERGVKGHFQAADEVQLSESKSQGGSLERDVDSVQTWFM